MVNHEFPSKKLEKWVERGSNRSLITHLSINERMNGRFDLDCSQTLEGVRALKYVCASSLAL